MSKRRVLTVIMDGVGDSKVIFGNAVRTARTPHLDWLKKNAIYRTLFAHGTYVGLPSDSDIGNSEVGHNALGAGKIFDQGAKLVSKAIASGAIFKGKSWLEIKSRCAKNQNSTLHFLGLLSDGNVHSHEDHLYKMMENAVNEGIKKIRVHTLFDGRDVGEKTAEIYVKRLEAQMSKWNEKGADIKVASAGGRMQLTMDRYNADWKMVERGWKIHVRGEGPLYPSLSEGLAALRMQTDAGDQYLPGIVIGDKGTPSGKINSGDSVVFFNFRGDRAIEISRAFTESSFEEFDRGPLGDIFFAGMMEYDGDLHIPEHYLVSPPEISNTLGERLASLGVRQFACSETQKFGHVTFFWNGNRSGYFDRKLEEYLEIPSDNIQFDLKPWMKAFEITEATIQRMADASFEYGRINFANGDMVGHTGDFDASVIAVEIVDRMIGRLVQAARKYNVILMITADHGNADEMFDGNPKDFPSDWEDLPIDRRPTPKTSHTLSPVPFIVFDPKGAGDWTLSSVDSLGLANVANSVLTLLGLKNYEDFASSIVGVK
ncbi:MAG: 2,3-bisphosphoglycerate-independent phosphoglycerate mutase [Pseudomonadota bacterium]